MTNFIAFEMAPKRLQLSLSEKNTTAALHKAGLKGPMSYGILKPMVLVF